MRDLYINRSERYGDAVSVTISDYVQLNPAAYFEARRDGIYERIGDENWERVADMVTPDASDPAVRELRRELKAEVEHIFAAHASDQARLVEALADALVWAYRMGRDATLGAEG